MEPSWLSILFGFFLVVLGLYGLYFAYRIWKEPNHTKAEFGEFDAILVSPKSWYLIESKWDNLRVQQKVIVKLSPVQLLRHELFKWYFENWEEGTSYTQFYDSYEINFPEDFMDRQRKIAPKDSLLSNNIEFILGHKSTDAIKNVFLYFHQEHYEPTVIIKTDNVEFLPMTIGYPINGNGNFICISR